MHELASLLLLQLMLLLLLLEIMQLELVERNTVKSSKMIKKLLVDEVFVRSSLRYCTAFILKNGVSHLPGITAH